MLQNSSSSSSSSIEDTFIQNLTIDIAFHFQAIFFQIIKLN